MKKLNIIKTVRPEFVEGYERFLIKSKLKPFVLGSIIAFTQVFAGPCDGPVYQECFAPTNEQCLCQAVGEANDALNNFCTASSIVDTIANLNSSILSYLITADQVTKATVSVAEQIFIPQSLIEQSIFNLINSTTSNIIENLKLTSEIDIALVLSTTIVNDTSIIESSINQLYTDVISINNILLSCPTSLISTATTINTPGLYSLCNNITGNITIAANDVELNLNNYTVTNVGATALTINGNSRIRVLNGYVTGATGVSINPGAAAVTVSDVQARNTTTAGFTGNAVSNIKIINCSADSALWGIQLLNSSSCLIQRCDMTNTTTGSEFTNCSGICIENCTVNQVTRAGYSFVSSTNNLIRNSKAFSTGANATSGSTYGFISQNGSGNVFDTISAQGTLTPDIHDGIYAAGLVFTGTESCSKVINSNFSSNFISSLSNAIPYGIYLVPTLSSLSTVTQTLFSTGEPDLLAFATTSTAVQAVAWSPDGRFLAAVGPRAGNGTTANPYVTLQVFQYDTINNVLNLVATSDHGGTVNSVAWTLDQQFIAIGGVRATSTNSCNSFPATHRVYRFDPYVNSLQEVAHADLGAGAVVNSVSWTIDSLFLAVGSNVVTNGSFSPSTFSVSIYSFNECLYQLTPATAANHGATVNSVAWSNDSSLKAYLAIAGNPSSLITHRVYPFTSSPTPTLSTPSNASWGATLNTIAWANEGNDDCYLLVGGANNGSATVGIYGFTKSTNTLNGSALATANHGATAIVNSVSWANNYSYFAIGGTAGTGGFTERIYQFNRTTPAIVGPLVSSSSYSATINGISWAPDGRLIAVGGNVPANNNEILVQSALTFPSNNVITNNTTYCMNAAMPLCPRGVGISGSSIANFITNNLAYNCVMPYQFIPNTFNGTSDGTPSSLQNVYFASNTAIANQSDPLTDAQQVETILTSSATIAQINSMVTLSADIVNKTNTSILSSIMTMTSNISDITTAATNALYISSILDNIAPLSACYAITVTAATTITAAGSYCLGNAITGQIVINSNDVVLDLNGYRIQNDTNGVQVAANKQWITIKNGIISTETGDGVLINSGCFGINVQNIVARQSLHGINVQSAHHVTIQNCDCSYNTTGIEADNSYKVVIDSCNLFSNQNAGVSFVSSSSSVVINTIALTTGITSTFNGGGAKGSSFGFVSKNGTGNIFETCIAEGTTTNSTSVNVVVAGFALTSSENCTKIIGCESGNNWAPSTTSGSVVLAPSTYGIYLPETVLLSNSTTALTSITMSGEPQVIAWSPNGQYFATANQNNNTVSIISISNPASASSVIATISLPAATSPSPYGVTWSPDGLYLATANYDNNVANAGSVTIINVVNPAVPQIVTTLKLNQTGTQSVAWSPNNQYIAAANSGSSNVTIINVSNPTSPSIIATIASGAAGISTVSWSPNSQYFFGTNNGVSSPTSISFFSVSPAAIVSTFSIASASGGGAFDGRWSPNGEYVAVATFGGPGYAGTIAIINAVNPASPLLVATINVNQGLTAVSWSPNNKYLATTSYNANEIFVYNTTNISSPTQIAVFATSSSPQCLAWSPDGSYIAEGNQSATPLQLFSALSFPSNNVIKDNIVWCNNAGSATQAYGVGISGSNIQNAIMNNLSYNNSVANYQFVTTPFTQALDGNGIPSTVQNVSANYNEPIANPNNIYQTLVCLQDLYVSMNSRLDLILTKTFH